MKIIRLNIIAFGKLKNTVITLGDKNFIYAPNGAGKSTAAAFIRVMLTGPDRGDRRRYIPWNEAVARGELTLEHEGDEYIISRSFGASSGSDSCNIVYAKTGEAVKKKPAALFGLDESMFTGTAFVAQASTVLTNGEALSEALREAVFGSGTGGEKALKLLDDRRRLLTNPRGKNKGELDIVNQQLSELEYKRDLSLREKNSLPALLRSLEQAEKRLADAKTRYAAAITAEKDEAARPEVRDAAEAAELLKDKAEGLSLEAEEYAAASRIPHAFALRGLSWVVTAAAALLCALLLGFKLYSPALAATVLLAAGILGGIFFAKICRRLKLSGITSDALITEFGEKAAEKRRELAAVKRELAARESRLHRSEQSPAAQQATGGSAGAETEMNLASREVYRINDEIEKAKAQSPQSWDEKINTLKAERDALKARVSVIDRASEGITNVLGKLSESWLPSFGAKVSQKASELLGREVSLLIDSDLNISVRLDGVREAALFSMGTRDQLYLALRLSAAEALFPSCPPPLILDDAFVQYDEEREAAAVDILVDYSKKYQIIFFSCKNSPVFKNKGFKILTI